MKLIKKMFISPTQLEGYRLVTGEEATNFLKAQGATFIHVDEQGKIHALSNTMDYLDGHYVYEKTVVSLK